MIRATFTKILSIGEHPNADKLELARVYGYDVVVRKGLYSVGDVVFYIPIDSILPSSLENLLTGKIKFRNSRVRQERIRGFPSQGLLVETDVVNRACSLGKWELERDYFDRVGLVKWEPPQRVGKQFNSKHVLSLSENFKRYGGLENIKRCVGLFTEGELVSVEEKIHGSNARAGIVRANPCGWFVGLLRFLKILPSWVNCYGSNNVQVSTSSDCVWSVVFRGMGIFSKLHRGETVYGEIYGGGIQKGYSYGTLKPKFVLFDVLKDGVWLNPDQVRVYAQERGFRVVPQVYRGEFKAELVEEWTTGGSLFSKDQKVREGVVIKSIGHFLGDRRKACKSINPDYLDMNGTDYH